MVALHWALLVGACVQLAYVTMFVCVLLVRPSVPLACPARRMVVRQNPSISEVSVLGKFLLLFGSYVSPSSRLDVFVILFVPDCFLQARLGTSLTSAPRLRARVVRDQRRLGTHLR